MGFYTPAPLEFVNPDHPDWYTANDPPSWCFQRNTEYYFYQRFDRLNAFCEGRVYKHQWVSCITDFWILGMAFWMSSWDHNYAIMRFVTACIAVNAVGSFFNHYYGTRQWMVMDNSSMYIELWIIASVVWDATYRHYRKLFESSLNQSHQDLGRPAVKSAIWTLCGFAIWALLFRDIAGCKWDPDETWFIVGIAIPLVSLAVNWLIFVRFFNKRKNLSQQLEDMGWGKDGEGLKTLKSTEQYMKWGVVITLVSAAVWIGFETPCKNPDNRWLGYVPGHGVWHVGMSYGLALIGLWFTTINSYLEQNYFGYKSIEQRILRFRCACKCATKWNDCLQFVFPVITNNHNSIAPDEFQCHACCRFCCKDLHFNLCSRTEEAMDGLVNDNQDDKNEAKNASVELEIKDTKPDTNEQENEAKDE